MFRTNIINNLRSLNTLKTTHHYIASTRFASTLVVAEHSNGKLSDQTLAVVTAAKNVGGDITILVAGSNSDDISKQASTVSGVSKVLSASDPAYDNAVAENVAGLITAISKDYSHILFSATNEGKNIAPRVCAKLDTSPVSEILSVVSEDTFKRPMYAGNAIATVKSKDPIKVITVRTTAFDKADVGGDSVSVDATSGPGDANMSKWVANEVSASDRPDLTSAKTVIAGGRGMQNGDNFKILYELADKIPGGAAVGASRAAVDAGYVPNELQIGQTGKVVAPSLYIGVGISGAIQVGFFI